jgi:hypothetical protein
MVLLLEKIRAETERRVPWDKERYRVRRLSTPHDDATFLKPTGVCHQATPPFDDVNYLRSNGAYCPKEGPHQIWSQSDKPFLRYRRDLLSADDVTRPRPLLMTSLSCGQLVHVAPRKVHTKLENNRTNRSWDIGIFHFPLMTSSQGGVVRWRHRHMMFL